MEGIGSDRPRVSVLIGCWNNAPTLPKAIESVLSQTLTELELLVVDDGSTDETREPVRALDDPRYRYAMDHDLWLRLADSHVVVTLDEVLAVRRMSGTNVAARSERAQLLETLSIRGATLRRRRTLRGGLGLLLPAVSYLTPLG